MSKVEREVEKLIKTTLDKNKSELEMAFIKPISPDYKYSTNGIYFFFGKQGSGKSYEIWKHIMITERMNKKPYYSKIIFCSTSGSLDKTAKAMVSNIKTPIVYVKDKELLPYLNNHLKWKNKYYSIAQHVLSNLVKTDDNMRRIIEKHGLEDLEDRLDYITMKLMKYQTTEYPYNTLLVLDDFAGNPLIKSPDSELCRLITKNRHYNLTTIIVAQTWRFIQLNIKRMATDVLIYAGFSAEDFKKILQQTNNNLDVNKTISIYKALKDIHSKFIMHIVANEYYFDDPNINEIFNQ